MDTSKRARIRFGLRNFKAFRYLEALELKPLTLLVGANNVGKSSILQSLLVLAQSTRFHYQQGLRFNGHLVKLGNYGAVISDFDVTKRMEYTFEVLGDTPCRVDIAFSDVSAKDNSVTMQIAEGSSKFKVILDQTHGPDVEFTVDGRDVSVNGMFFEGLWPESIHAHPSDAEHVQSLSDWVGYARIRALIDRQLRYLGPVRADPRPFYPVEDEPILGVRGKGAVPYLLKKSHDSVRYSVGPTGEVRKGPLIEAINEWLAYMEITTSLTIDPLESVAYTAAVRTPSIPGRSVNLAQVGFGISQILPVLIQGLKNPSNGFLLFEQPEIHLHPRLQGGLGDFLIGVSRAGRTVMVETHSDHLVNRIRRRIAEDPTGTLAEMVQILFVHPGTPDNPSSYVEPLSVDETGTIVNCPADFFSESADEAFAILNARRRKRQTP